MATGFDAYRLWADALDCAGIDWAQQPEYCCIKASVGLPPHGVQVFVGVEVSQR